MAEPPCLNDEILNVFKAVHRLKIGKQERTGATHFLGIAVHDAQIRPNKWRQIGFIDHQQVRPCNARPAFARDFIAG